MIIIIQSTTRLFFRYDNVGVVVQPEGVYERCPRLELKSDQSGNPRVQR